LLVESCEDLIPQSPELCKPNINCSIGSRRPRQRLSHQPSRQQRAPLEPRLTHSCILLQAQEKFAEILKSSAAQSIAQFIWRPTILKPSGLPISSNLRAPKLRCVPGGFSEPLVGALQIEHNSQGGVDAAHFFETEITHGVAEANRIDCCGLLSQHPRDLAVDLDVGPKARAAS
jgi:hypothetical protein